MLKSYDILTKGQAIVPVFYENTLARNSQRDNPYLGQII